MEKLGREIGQEKIRKQSRREMDSDVKVPPTSMEELFATCYESFVDGSVNKYAIADARRSHAGRHSEGEGLSAVNAFDLYRHALPTWGRGLLGIYTPKTRNV